MDFGYFQCLPYGEHIIFGHFRTFQDIEKGSYCGYHLWYAAVHVHDALSGNMESLFITNRTEPSIPSAIPEKLL